MKRAFPFLVFFALNIIVISNLYADSSKNETPNNVLLQAVDCINKGETEQAAECFHDDYFVKHAEEFWSYLKDVSSDQIAYGSLRYGDIERFTFQDGKIVKPDPKELFIQFMTPVALLAKETAKMGLVVPLPKIEKCEIVEDTLAYITYIDTIQLRGLDSIHADLPLQTPESAVQLNRDGTWKIIQMSILDAKSEEK